MSEWVVYGKDGLTEKCRLKSVEYSGSFLNERAVSATIENHSKIQFEVFDYIEYRGERFELESIPTVKKTSSFSYEYELRFVSYKYELERCEMRDIVPNDNRVVYPTPLTFSFTGDVRYLVERIQACLDELYGKDVWKLSVADDVASEEKNITISQQNCWNALSLVNTTYGLNFYIKGRNATIGGSQPILNHIFQYGKGNGLYEIERISDTDTAIITKLRAYGSDRNLDYSYPKKPEWSDSVLGVSFVLSPLRLMLPSFKKDGKTDYILADEATIEDYGIREASVIYDDIYPSITGAKNSQGQSIDEIMAVDAVDDTKSTFVIHLHDLGFDLESHLTTANAQISMKSGAMQGYTFNIAEDGIEKQEDNSYKITLGRITTDTSDTGNYDIPNSSWNMAAGDKFVFLNILMPQEYIREAENRLLERAKEYLAEYGKTNFSYNVGLHDKFLIENSDVYSSLVEGAKLTIHDEILGISEDVTIQSITITENAEDNILPQVKITLNNKPSASTLDRIQGQIKELSETTSGTFSSQSELLKQYRKKLDKPFFDRLFVAVGMDGKELPSTDMTSPIAYIKAKYSFVTIGGVTMYAQDSDIDIPTIAEGLPFDQRTIWFNPTTGQIEVIGGTGGGSGEGVSNFWELSGIPSWITNTKPTYSYSEIQGTPDLSKYALVSQIPSLNGYAKLTDIPSLSGYATQAWVNQQGFLTQHQDLSGYQPLITSSNKLAYSLISGTPTLAAVATSGKYSDLSGLPTIPTSLKNPYALSFGSKSYDGSEKITLSASDLGALTSHQTIHALTIKNSAGTTQLTYTPNSATGSLTLTKAMVGLGNVDNTALSTWAGTNKITTLGTITTGTWNGTKIANDYLANNKVSISGVNISLGGSITQSALRTALGLGSNAYTSTEYLPLSGGNIESSSGSPLKINSTHQGGSAIVFLHNGTDKSWFGYDKNVGRTYMYNTASQSYLGVRDNGTPYFNSYTLWHSGNDGSDSGLDADLLDGKHYSDIINGNVASATRIQAYTYNESEKIIVSGTRTDNTYYRSIYDNGFTYRLKNDARGVDADIATVADNVASATKLQTARTIWGQGFNGTNNVSGDIYFKNNNIIRFEDTNGESVSVVHFRGDNQLWFGRGVANLGYSSYLYGNSISFGYGTTGSIGMILNSSGNITVGSSDLASTSAKLYVDGRILIPNNSSLSVKDTNDSVVSAVYIAPSNGLHFGYGTNEKGYRTYINGNDIHLRYGTNQTTGMLMNSSGNVTIGASDLASTTYKFYVNGTIRATNYIYSDSLLWFKQGSEGIYIGHNAICWHNNGAAWVSNLIGFESNKVTINQSTTVQGDFLSTGGITMYSARKLKDIQDERGLSLEELSVIKPTRFAWKDGRDSKIHIGGIADDVMKVLPEVIYKTDDDTLTMDYGNAAFAIAASLIKPVVNHEERIKMLEEENKRLKEEIEQLKWNIA